MDKTSPGSEALAAFQNELQKLMYRKHGFVFDADELSTYDNIQRVFGDDGSGNGRLIPQAYLILFMVPELRARFLANGVWVALRTPNKQATIKQTQRLYAKLHEPQTKQPWQLHMEGKSYEYELSKVTHTNYFLAFTKYIFQGLFVFEARGKAEAEALLATVAGLRYQKDKGKTADSLDELVAEDYLAELPIDPFSGKALVYKKTDRSFMLYSFG